MFASLEETSSLIEFVTAKFESEIQIELEQMRKTQDEQDQDKINGSFGDDGSNLDESMYEKKANLILMQQIMLMKAENSQLQDQVIDLQKQFFLSCCLYLI